MDLPRSRAQIAREVAHQTGQLVPGVADRLHPRLHHPFLEVRGDVGQSLQGRGERAVLEAARKLQQLVAGEDELADQGHQVVEHVHCHADRLTGTGLAALRARFGRGTRRGRVGRRLVSGRLERLRHAGGRGCRLTFRSLVERGDQCAVIARWLGTGRTKAAQDGAHAVESRQHQGHDFGAGIERAIPQAAQNVLGGMGQPLQAWQAKKTASALDGMHRAKDLRQRRGVRGALQPQERRLQLGQALVRFHQKIRKQLIHCVFRSRIDAPPILAWMGEETIKLCGSDQQRRRFPAARRALFGSFQRESNAELVRNERHEGSQESARVVEGCQRGLLTGQ